MEFVLCVLSKVTWSDLGLFHGLEFLQGELRLEAVPFVFVCGLEVHKQCLHRLVDGWGVGDVRGQLGQHGRKEGGHVVGMDDHIHREAKHTAVALGEGLLVEGFRIRHSGFGPNKSLSIVSLGCAWTL